MEACTEAHILNSCHGQSTTSHAVFCDFVDAPRNEEVLQPVEKRNDRCSNCAVQFPIRKKYGIYRFSLRSLNINNSIFSSSGDFVCSNCRNYFLRSNRQTEKPKDLSLPKPYRCLPTSSYIAFQEPTATSVVVEIANDHNYHQPISACEEDVRDSLADHTYTHNSTSDAKPTDAVGIELPINTTTTGLTSKRPSSTTASCSSAKRARRQASVNVRTPHTTSFKPACIRYIQLSKYKQALNVMYRSKNRFVKAALIDFVCRCIREEAAKFVKSAKDTSVLRQPFSYENLSDFEWKTAVSEMELSMPVATAAVRSLFPEAKTVANHTLIGKKKQRR